MLSIIIPSRSDEYLQKTITDLLEKAEGEIEIIVVFDGIWPKNMPKDNRVSLVYHGSIHNNYGMRASINKGVKLSRGEYIMKIDEHCTVDQGYDVKLMADCGDNWIVTPRRYALKADEWWVDKKRAFDNMSFLYPYLGLYNVRSWTDLRKDILIDDCMAFQGSCYFMTRKHWDWLGGLDTGFYGKFHYEAQEICLKTWLGGGTVKVNKKTWYAHYHRRAKNYNFNKSQYKELDDSKSDLVKSVSDYWLNDCWEEAVHDFKWLLRKFAPVPYWPQDKQ